MALALFTSGGTISMNTARGATGAVARLQGNDLLDRTPGLDQLGHDVNIYDVPPVPSASLRFATVLEVIGRASDLAQDHAGVLLTQGTDTLEEVAYLVDLLWKHEQPFVLTGAMRNPTLNSPDGSANLLSAATVAVDPAARGLGALVAFNDDVHAARWVRKQHSTSVAAFGSPTQGPVGHVIEGKLALHNAPPRLPLLSQPDTRTATRTHVALYTVSFDDDGRLLEGVEDTHHGLVIAGVGAGHVPASLASRLSTIVERIPVVLASRAGSGPVLRRTYSAEGSEIDLQRRGLLPAGYLDAYKARVLLRVLLSNGADRHRIAEELEIRG